MDAERCWCRTADHSLMVTGMLLDGSQAACTFQREIVLDTGIAIHHYLKVEPAMRAAGIAPGLLKQGLDLYDALGLRRILVHAALETGRWYWARCGFDFASDQDRRLVTGYFDAVVSALGISVDTTSISTAYEYALAGPGITASMRDVAALLPASAEPEFQRRAAENDIDFAAQISAARAIMLCGPDWHGVMPLHGPQRTQFELYLQSRLSIVRQTIPR
jgi:hypothetical protein